MAGLAVHDKAAARPRLRRRSCRSSSAGRSTSATSSRRRSTGPCATSASATGRSTPPAIACAERIRAAANERAGGERGGDAGARAARWVASRCAPRARVGEGRRRDSRISVAAAQDEELVAVVVRVLAVHLGLATELGQDLERLVVPGVGLDQLSNAPSPWACRSSPTRPHTEERSGRTLRTQIARLSIERRPPSPSPGSPDRSWPSPRQAGSPSARRLP